MSVDHFTWRSAENLAVQHLQDLGFDDASITAQGRDGGLDVVGTGCAAQVKFRVTPVGSPDIQRLRGAAPNAKTVFFYSLSGYSAAAKNVAAETNIALFRYDTGGSVWPENEIAQLVVLEAGHSNPVGTVAGFDSRRRSDIARSLGLLYRDADCWDLALTTVIDLLRPTRGENFEGGWLAYDAALTAQIELSRGGSQLFFDYRIKRCFKLLEEGQPDSAAVQVVHARKMLDDWLEKWSAKFPRDWWDVLQKIQGREDTRAKAERDRPDLALWLLGKVD